MGIIGEKLKERGFSKTKLEMLNLVVSISFYIVLLWFVYTSGLLEWQCRGVLVTGKHVTFNPNDPPNLTKQITYINISNETECWTETVCRNITFCYFRVDYPQNMFVGT